LPWTISASKIRQRRIAEILGFPARSSPKSIMVRLAVLSVLVLGSAAADSVYFTNPRFVRPIDHSSASSIFNLRGGDTSFEIHDVAESDEEDAVGTAKTVLCLSAPLWLKMQDIPVRYLASRHQDTKTSRLQDIPVEWKLRITAPPKA